MNKTIAKTGFLLSLILLNSCYFTSVNTITENTVPKLREQLLGFWKLIPAEKSTSKDVGYVLFLKENKEHLRIVVLENNYEYDEEYQGFISVVKNEKYLNVKRISENSKTGLIEKDKSYSFVHYRINKNKLVMSLLNEKFIKSSIEKKALKGKITKGRLTTDVLLTDSSKKIESVFKKKKLKDLLDTDVLFRAKKVEHPTKP